MIDTVMIGAIGENEVAAVGVANQFFFLFNMVIYGVSSGVSIFISQYWGSGNRREIFRIIGLGLISLVLSGAVFTALAVFFPIPIMGLFSDSAAVLYLGREYLWIVCISYIPTAITYVFSHAQRSINNAALPMAISFLAILTNTVFNYLLIFGKLGLPALGVRGAAIATVLARFLECFLMLLISLKPGRPLRGRLQEYLSFDWTYIRSVYGVVLPVVMNEGLWGLGAVFYTAAYGRIGTAALAATNITNTVQNFFMVLCFSIASAALVMIGHQIGSGDKEKVKVYANRFTILTGLLGLFLGVLILLSGSWILSFFRISEGAIRSAMVILKIFGLTYCIRQINLVLIVGIFRGGGDAKACLAMDLSTMWLVGVPLAFLGAVYWRLPVEQVVALITIEEFIKFLMAMLRLKSGRWIHDLTEGI